MPLTPDERAKFERLGVENVRQRLNYGGAGDGSIIPGLGIQRDVVRREVEDWLYDKDRETAKLQTDILWWAKAATWIGGLSLLVVVVIAVLSYVFPAK